ncbi:MAG: hypothetical protein IJH77_05030, partial [Mogibacterium sp.]|nr:hypothetical protein [Mogibacterium sp.]
GKKIRIRTPVIPGFNDSVDNLKAEAAFLIKNRILRIDLLPFHLTGSFKYNTLNKIYDYLDFREPLREEMQMHLNLFKKLGREIGLSGTVGGTDIPADD